MTLPPPIIPQTPQQARDRDQLHHHAQQPVETSAQKAHRLEQAIRQHQQHVQTPEHNQTTSHRDAADLMLWAHTPSQPT